MRGGRSDEGGKSDVGGLYNRVMSTVVTNCLPLLQESAPDSSWIRPELDLKHLPRLRAPQAIDVSDLLGYPCAQFVTSQWRVEVVRRENRR